MMHTPHQVVEGSIDKPDFKEEQNKSDTANSYHDDLTDRPVDHLLTLHEVRLQAIETNNRRG
jgi:hypothetical protein